MGRSGCRLSALWLSPLLRAMECVLQCVRAAAQYPHGAGGGSTGELRSNSLRMECPCLGQWTP